MKPSTEFKEVTVMRLSAGSLLKIVALGNLFAFVPLMTLIGVLAAFGADIMKFNDANIHGIIALVVSPLYGFLFAVIATILGGSAIVAGMGLYALFRPLTLLTKQAVESDASDGRPTAELPSSLNDH